MYTLQNRNENAYKKSLPLQFLECYHTITSPSDFIFPRDSMKFYSLPEQKIEVSREVWSANNHSAAKIQILLVIVYVQAKRYFVSLHPKWHS